MGHSMKFRYLISLFFLVVLVSGANEYYQNYKFITLISSSVCGTSISDFALWQAGKHCPGCYKVISAFVGLILVGLSSQELWKRDEEEGLFKLPFLPLEYSRRLNLFSKT